MSYRTSISEAIKTLLVGNTPAGLSVFTSLDRKLDPASDLPAIMIYTMASRRGPESYGDALIPRIVSVAIEAAVSSYSGNELELVQELADAIETAIEADPTLGNLVTDTNWQQTISDVTSAGEVPIGVCVLEYSIDMFTNPKPDGAYEFTDPDLVLDDQPTTVSSDIGIDTPDFGENLTIEDVACGPDGCDLPAWAGDTP